MEDVNLQFTTFPIDNNDKLESTPIMEGVPQNADMPVSHSTMQAVPQDNNDMPDPARVLEEMFHGNIEIPGTTALEEIPQDNADMPDSGPILEDSIQICPLCSSPVKLFFINFNEKFLMCENPDCEYPFGHDDLKFYKDVSDSHSGDDVCSIKSFTTPSIAASTISSSGWADIDQMNKVNESEDIHFDMKSVESRDKAVKPQKNNHSEEQLIKSVETIKELTKELTDTGKSKVHCINNEKWLKNLMSKQAPGIKLLRQGEIEKLKKTELTIGATELKIDIDSSPNNVSTITIEIAKQ